MKEAGIKKEVWEIVKAMNREWSIKGNADELKNYFHRNMVAITATNRERLQGKDACVASWKAFIEAAKIHYWKEIDPEVQLYGDSKFAVVTYYYDISFDMGDQTIKDEGRDMFILVNEDEKWWIVADQFSPFPKQ